jgi:hypothetical protein
MDSFGILEGSLLLVEEQFIFIRSFEFGAGIMLTALLAFFLLLLVSVVTSSHNADAFQTLVARFSFSKTVHGHVHVPSLETTSTSISSIHWWKDFAPPFRLPGEEEEEECECEWLPPDLQADITHFCFLVHGHRGFSKDLGYVQTAMRRVASIEKQKRLLQEDVSSGSSREEDSSTELPDLLRHDMIVHSVSCNEGKTTDGIARGGERLADEIVSVIRQEMETRHPIDPSEETNSIKEATISILGNSLGGVYGRYAIAKLAERCVQESPGCYILDGRFRLMMNVFCTTATPHLGIAGHTFLPLPRTAEIGVG